MPSLLQMLAKAGPDLPAGTGWAFETKCVRAPARNQLRSVRREQLEEDGEGPEHP
jgi:hypothetical protein